MPSTVRELVKAAQREMRGDLLPARGRDLLLEMTALIGSCNQELREAEIAYKHVLLAQLEQQAKANRARIAAECSPEYARFREAKDTKENVVETVRSLKAMLRNLEEELRLAR